MEPYAQIFGISPWSDPMKLQSPAGRADAEAKELARQQEVAMRLQYAESLRGSESPKSRAFRLLAEAKARHPEWVVKRLTPRSENLA